MCSAVVHAAPASRDIPVGGFRLPEWPAGAGTPAFSLVDVDGNSRSLSDYRGKVVVIYFGFTHCPDACPAELMKLALVMKHLGVHSRAVQVLFVTLDPARDTPALLKAYVNAFDPQFVGLTGTAAQIDQAAAVFFVQYARVQQGHDYVIDHSNRVAVIDGAGQLRLMANADSSVADLTHDLEALAVEPSRR
jgi:protein SCO1/2